MKEMTTEEKVKEFEKELKLLLEKYGLEMIMDIDFPQYKELPVKIQLALQVIFEEKVQFVSRYKPVEKSKEK